MIKKQEKIVVLIKYYSHSHNTSSVKVWQMKEKATRDSEEKKTTTMRQSCSQTRRSYYEKYEEMPLVVSSSEDFNVDEFISKKTLQNIGASSNQISSSTIKSSSHRRRNHRMYKKKEHARSRSNQLNSDLNRDKNSSPVEFYYVCHGCCWVQCVRTNEVAIVTKFGEFHDIRHHGLLCLPSWPITRVEKRLPLRIQQFNLTCETKTKDNGMWWIGIFFSHYTFWYFLHNICIPMGFVHFAFFFIKYLSHLTSQFYTK